MASQRGTIPPRPPRRIPPRPPRRIPPRPPRTEEELPLPVVPSPGPLELPWAPRRVPAPLQAQGGEKREETSVGECCICLETGRVAPSGVCSAGHKVCVSCQSQMARNECPVCRERLNFTPAKLTPEREKRELL